MRILEWIVIAALFFALGWFGNDYFTAHPLQLGTNAPQQEESTGNDSELCAQVLTPAVNPDTGDIQEFPTPCDVPEGWEVIQNDIPGGIDETNPQLQ